MNRSFWRYFAEVGSILSVFSLTFSGIVSYFAFESVGLSFARVASIEDTVLIGVGLLVRLLPLFILGYFQFTLLKYLFGAVKAFGDQVTPSFGLQSNRVAVPYHIFSLILSVIVSVWLIYNSAFNSYYSIYANIIICLLSVISKFSFLFLTNFLIRNKVISFGGDDPYYYLQQVDVESISDSSRKKREDFNRGVLKFVSFLIALGAWPVLISSARAPLESDFTIVAAGDNSLSQDCVGSKVLWSGTRSIVYRCRGEIIVVQGPQNVILKSDGVNRLERSISDFLGIT